MRPQPLLARTIAGFIFATALPVAALAQAQSPKAPEPTNAPEPSAASFAERHPYGPTSSRVFTLKNITQVQEGNEILTALRNTLDPRDRMTYIPSHNVILIEAPDDHLAEAEKLIDALDKPKKSYRLTYTLIDLDGTKRLGDQHYSMVVFPGQRALVRQGNKVPIITGSYDKDASTTISQVTYVDLGMNFDATLDDAPNALRLKTKVEESSVTEERTGATAANDPVLRQAVFEGSTVLVLGKPLTIGSLDIAGTTRRIEIQVMAEPITY